MNDESLLISTKIRQRKIQIALGGILLVVLFGTGAWYYVTHFNWRSPGQILSIIQKEIIPSIVLVACTDTEGGAETQSGSGVYFTDDKGNPWIETNAHVVLTGHDNKYHGCNVYFPNSDGSFYDSAYVTGPPLLSDKEKSIVDGQTIDGLDYAQLPLTNSITGVAGAPFPFPPKKKNVYKIVQSMCPNPTHVLIGNPIYVIGYPGIGGNSVTLTQGVISEAGGDTDEFVKVSAGINHGNSGGFAIDAGSGCSLGMPTSATFESGSNLGYLLDSGFINRFISGKTGESVYAPPPADATSTASLLINTYDFPDVTIQYPDAWTISTSSPDVKRQDIKVVNFTAPPEGVLDNFNEELTAGMTSNQPKTAFTSLVKEIKADTYYPVLKPASYSTIDGVKIFQITTVDQYDYPVPVWVNRIIFWYNNTLYDFSAVSETGSDKEGYLLLFKSMVDSLRFK